MAQGKNVHREVSRGALHYIDYSKIHGSVDAWRVINIQTMIARRILHQPVPYDVA